MNADPETILNFWFFEIGPDRWFADDPALDETLRTNFLAAYEQAARGELKAWAETPEGTLCLLLLLDFWPRRMFRGTARAYETDDAALDLARSAIIRHFDDRIDKSFKLLMYLPFSHAENMGDQRLAMFYIRERTKEDAWIDAAEANLGLIQQFGRFPARNKVLGREDTPEEAAYAGKSGHVAALFD